MARMHGQFALALFLVWFSVYLGGAQARFSSVDLWSPSSRYGWDNSFDNRMSALENAFFGDLYRRNSDSDKEKYVALAAWRPRCDVSETPTHIVVKAELPGVPKDKVTVDLEKNILTISGEHSEEKVHDEEKFHYVERSSGSFRRSFTLPDGVTSQSIEAKFNDGVLDVRVAKPGPQEPKTTRIAIN